VKAHLVHEAVRAELNARRAGTRGAKSRGLVSGGRSKPWRQKGTGRARQGTTRAVQWKGGGVAFPPTMRSFALKVNRKAARAAMRSVLSAHVQASSFFILDGTAFAEPSTKRAAALIAARELTLPLVVIADAEEETVLKSFRNLDRVGVATPAETEVTALTWARSVCVTEKALDALQRRAS